MKGTSFQGNILYKHLFMQANDAIILFDGEDRIVDVNGRACGLYGYTREEFLSLTVADLKPEGRTEQDPGLRMRWEIATYGSGSFETLDVRRDGSEMFVEVTNSVLTEHNKTYVFSIVRDHTAQKEAERELERSEAVKRSIMESTHGINIWAVDTEYRYTFFNNAHQQGMKEVWGADIELGKCILDYLTDPVYLEQVKGKYNALIMGETHYSTDRLKNTEGITRFYENTGYPIFNDKGEVTGATVYTTDVTGRVRVDRELKQNFALLESIMNSPPDIIILSVDRDFKYIFFNNAHRQAMLDIWGVEPELGKCSFDLIPDHEYGEKVRRNYERRLSGEMISDIDEFIDKAGKRRYFENIPSPILDSNGEIIGITIFIIEVTERIFAEERRRESLKEKEILLKEVHHRVKNNLQIISSMLSMQVDMAEDIKVQFQLREGQNRINTMALIHDQLYQSENLARIEMEDYIRNLVSFVIDSYRKNETAVHAEFLLSPVILNLDQAIPLGLIINELVSNSMKYAFRGRQTGQLSIALGKAEDSRLQFIIKDDGIGLPGDFDKASLKTLGMQLISALAQQIHGEFELKTGDGVEALIRFSIEDHS